MTNVFVVFGVSILVLAVLMFFGTRKQFNTINKDTYLSVDQTNWLRGIAIFMVVMSHYYEVLGISKYGAFWQVKCAGFFGVAVFLFLSGYGAIMSKTTKQNYLKGYLPKKALRLYIPFLLAFLVDILLIYVFTKDFSFSYFLGIPIMSLPETLNWYLKVQLGLYVVFYIVSKIFKSDKTIISIVFVLCIIYMIIGTITKIDFCWFESSYLFPLGMFFGKYKNKIYALLDRKFSITITISILFAMFSYVPYYLFGGLFAEMLFILGFLQFLLCICVKTKGTFKLTKLMGILSIDIYLSHIVIINSIILSLDIDQSVFSYILFLLTSILLAYLLNMLGDIIVKYIKIR